MGACLRLGKSEVFGVNPKLVPAGRKIYFEGGHFY